MTPPGSSIELHLMGSFHVRRGGTPVTGFESDHVRALLAYLAVERDRPHRRETLAGLLWPDEPEEVALHRLRQALGNLRLVLGDRDAEVPVLRVTRADVQLNPERAVWFDVAAFDELLGACRTHPHRSPDLCLPCTRRLEQAVALVRGQLLAGLSLARSSQFDDWAVTQRERVHQQACTVLEAVARLHERRGAHERAIEHARQVLALEPWREGAHRSMMRCLAGGGDRAGALRQYIVCARVLARELGIEPEEETRALRDAIEAGAFPPERPEPARGLSPQRTRFVGRVAELARLLDLIACERMVTLTGPGGCGKTRLALRLAEELAPDLPGRVWLVELDRVVGPELVVPAIAAAIGVDGRGRGPLLERVVERLRDEEGLLLLDNCEHVRVECARAVAQLMRECHGLGVLATSREPLRVVEEVVWPVPPLGLPADEPIGQDLAAVAASEAVSLFVARVQRTRPSFALTPENASAVAGICQLLDGLPLAIELAASRARWLAPEIVLSRLDAGLALSAPEAGAAPPRHRSLRDVLDWSHDLLSAREQVLFRRLAVFADHWSIEMAEAVCADPPGPGAELARGEVLDAMGGLFDKSLLFAVDSPGGTRYRFLETVRQYAAEKLDEADEGPRLRDRQARCLLELAEAATPRLRGPDQLTWLERLEREQPNFGVALDWVFARGDTELSLRLVGGLAWFWHLRGHWRLGYDRAARALTLPGAAAHPARARVLYGLGFLAVDLGMEDEAVGPLRESLAVFRAAGDRAGEAEALNVLGLATSSRDDAAADEYFAEALGISEGLGDRWGVGRALWNLGDTARRRGDLTTARGLLGRAVEELRQAGVLMAVGIVLADLARVAEAEGARAEARRLYAESLAAHRRFGSRYQVVACLRDLAALDAAEGSAASAEALLEEARRTAHELGRADLAAEITRELSGLTVAPRRSTRAGNGRVVSFRTGRDRRLALSVER